VARHREDDLASAHALCIVLGELGAKADETFHAARQPCSREPFSRYSK
jgi:hypothetical protein